MTHFEKLKKQVAERPMKMDKNRNSWLHQVDVLRYVSLIDLLNKKGVDINSLNKDKMSPLEVAIIANITQAVFKLLKIGSSFFNREGFNPLMASASTGNIKLVKHFVEVFSVNDADNDHYTALSWAIQEGHYATANFLLERGADPNLNIEKRIYSPMHIASTLNLRYVKLLHSYDADMNAQNEEGETPLHLSIAFSQIDIARYLLRSNVLVNLENLDGLTPERLADQIGNRSQIFK